MLLSYQYCWQKIRTSKEGNPPPALARKNETKETAIPALGTQNDPVNTLLWPILLSLALCFKAWAIGADYVT